MKKESHIEWTEITWNPTTGCNKISEGCKYCYAERWAIMQQARGIEQYKEGFKFKLAPNRLNQPLSWRGSKLVFVNSMSDLFHENMPLSYLEEIFEIMNSVPQHTFQILTKRIERVELYSTLKWTKNIWLGVSVENMKTTKRIEFLKRSPAKLKFISFEPLLEEAGSIDLNGIDWVIVGGESGGKARVIEKDWVLKLLKLSAQLNIPFFFKQWGKKEFNPDKHDPTIKKENRFYAKGGCQIDKTVIRQFPKKEVCHYQ